MTLRDLLPFGLGTLGKEKSLVGVGGEGSWRGPFNGQGELGNWFQHEQLGDGWQRNITRPGNDMRTAILYACVMLIARAMSQMTPLHIREDDSGSWETVRTSAAYRIFRTPNLYETFTLLVTNTVAETLFAGESIWVAVRNDRQEIEAVHRIPRHGWTVHVDDETSAIFYAVSTNGNLPWKAPDMMIPARDVAHFRLHTPRHPLVGESPAKAAALALGINVALTESQLAFFSQMNRPSGVMSTDERLTVEQMRQLRAAFNEQSKAWQAGGVPILGSGLKFQPMAIAANDAQLIEQQRMSIADVARVYGVPMALLAENSSGPQGGTEALITHWLSVGLGSVVESFERTLDQFFRMDGHNQVQMDPTPLLRADLDARIGALVKAVQGGLMTPDEARAKERMGPTPGGDRAFMQRQNTPLDLLSDIHAADLANAVAPPPAPVVVDPEEEPEPVEEASIDPAIVRALTSELMTRKKAHARH